MATNKNDKVILALRKQVADKKTALKQSERFTPITNCSLELDSVRYNIHTLNKEQLVQVLVKLNVYFWSATNLDLADSYTLSGYKVEDWITDLKSKLTHVDRKNEEAKLKALEDKLSALLSNEKKVELEIENIKQSLEGI